jgi:hypothetical protein
MVIRTAKNFRQSLEEACVNGKDNIKVVLKGYRDADWIRFNQDRIQWCDFVRIVKNV